MIRLGKILALLGMALWLGGCAVNPVTGKKELSLMSMSPQQEKELGRQAYPELIQKMDGQYSDRRLQTYINQVGQSVARQSHKPNLGYEFTVINSSIPNAFALPGGYIGITRGLLVALENEAQLAAVLGHEIVHVTARHSDQAIQRGTLYGAAMAGLGAALGDSYGPMSQRASQLAAEVMQKGYSRENETEADLIGIDYMVKAGYNPAGAIQLMEFFYREVEKGAQPNWVKGVFRTHPFSKDRLDANRAYVAKRYPGSRGALGVRSFQEATRGVKKSKEAYELFDKARELESRNQLSQAIDLYHQAVAKGPDQALIHAGLGLAYLRMEDMVPARRYLLKAIQFDNNYFESQYGLGYVYLQRKENRKAETHLKKGFDLLPTVQGAFLLAESYERNDKRQEAYRLYSAVANADRGKLGQMARRRAQNIAR